VIQYICYGLLWFWLLVFVATMVIALVGTGPAG
jgi:hypothetical protein